MNNSALNKSGYHNGVVVCDWCSAYWLNIGVVLIYRHTCGHSLPIILYLLCLF